MVGLGVGMGRKVGKVTVRKARGSQKTLRRGESGENTGSAGKSVVGAFWQVGR